MSKKAECWFRYIDDELKKSYYYNASTKEVTWKFPTSANATVWDAKSKRKLYLPSMRNKGKASPRSSSPRSAPSKPAPPSDDESSESESSSSSSSSGSSGAPEPTGPEMPDFSKDLVNLYAESTVDFAKFESTYLNKSKKDAFAFSEKPIEGALLKDLKKPEGKIAVKNYKLILKLTGVSIKAKGDVTDMVKAIKESPFLKDEIYVELWKQTIKASAASLQISLQAFLVMATLFEPAQYLKLPLLNHIALIAKKIEYARFVLIRLEEICASGKESFSPKDDSEILEIANHTNNSNFYFGVSPYEIFWHQRKTRLHSPIPFALYLMLEAINKQGGRDKVGIFRSSGNQARLNELALKSNKGEEFLSNENLDDITSLVKKWLRDIPGRLIKADKARDWDEVKSEEEAVEFADGLVKPVQLILKYLIGYLRDLASNSGTNQMDTKALATAFGPHITYENDDDPLGFQKKQQFLIQSLIEKWDVSEVYPANEGWLRKSK